MKYTYDSDKTHYKQGFCYSLTWKQEVMGVGNYWSPFNATVLLSEIAICWKDVLNFKMKPIVPLISKEYFILW